MAKQQQTEAQWEASIAAKLTAATGTTITPANMAGWMHGGRGAAKVDRVVRQYLGADRYEAGESTARLDSLLEAVLDGKRTVTVGGVTFKNLQRRDLNKPAKQGDSLTDILALTFDGAATSRDLKTFARIERFIEAPTTSLEDAIKAADHYSNKGMGCGRIRSKRALLNWYVEPETRSARALVKRLRAA